RAAPRGARAAFAGASARSRPGAMTPSDSRIGSASGDPGQEIQYRLTPRPPRSARGQQRSRALGPGLDVHGFAPLETYPDARRLDLRVSARDPFGRWLLRLPPQRARATLVGAS